MKRTATSHVLFLSALLVIAPRQWAQQPVAGPSGSQPILPLSANPTVSFAFERPGLPVPRYTLTVNDQGLVDYAGDQVASASGVANAGAEPQHFQQRAVLSATTTHRIFALAHGLHSFDFPCASKAKNIADTGKKTLTYTEAGKTTPAGSCTYNYTESKDVQALTDILLGITETMDQGRELDRLHRYDRLGLDAAMIFLTQEVKDGRAHRDWNYRPVVTLHCRRPGCNGARPHPGERFTCPRNCQPRSAR